jgi:drug/metabolite transporter (DMT)-like permease
VRLLTHSVGLSAGRIGSSRKSLIAGAELGLWSFAGFGLQAVGLMTTTASRSAFLLYLNVKLVPVLQICIDGKVAPLRTWVSAALAVAGTCLIVADGSTPPNSGDLWCAAAAVASAGFIIRMGHYATDTADATVVTATCAAVCVVLGMTTVHVLAVWRRQECWGPAPATCHFAAAAQSAEILVSTGRDHTLAIVYLGLVPTGLCTFLQAVGQRTVPPEKASLIYALDPLYAAIVAYFTLGERLYLQGFLGGALIVAGILVSSWQPVPPTVQAKESRTLSL